MPSLFFGRSIGYEELDKWKFEQINLRLNEASKRTDGSKTDLPSDDSAERQKQSRNGYGREKPEAVSMVGLRPRA